MEFQTVAVSSNSQQSLSDWQEHTASDGRRYVFVFTTSLLLISCLGIQKAGLEKCFLLNRLWFLTIFQMLGTCHLHTS
jgi:hypothetical protein